MTLPGTKYACTIHRNCFVIENKNQCSRGLISDGTVRRQKSIRLCFCYPDTRIRGYAKEAAKLFLFAAVLSCIRFVKFCQTGNFVARIPGYTLQNDHFPSVYLFFVFVARIALPRGRAICLFLTPVRTRGRQKLLFSYPKFAKIGE